MSQRKSHRKKGKPLQQASTRVANAKSESDKIIDPPNKVTNTQEEAKQGESVRLQQGLLAKSWRVVLRQFPGFSVGTCLTSVGWALAVLQIWSIGEPSAATRPRNPHTYAFAVQNNSKIPLFRVSISCATSVTASFEDRPFTIGGLDSFMKPTEYGKWLGSEQSSFVCDPRVPWVRLSRKLLPLGSSPPTPPSMQEMDRLAKEIRVRIRIDYWLFVIPWSKEFWFYAARNSEGNFAWRLMRNREEVMAIRMNQEHLRSLQGDSALTK